MNWREFDIHGLATMRVALDAPTEPLLSEMFRPFLTEGLGRYDLSITARGEHPAGASHAEEHYRYTADQVNILGARASIRLEGEDFHLSGKGELLSSALPLLDVILARKGVAMIHAASIEYRGRGIALPAWGGTGKTSALSQLARSRGACFMGDDWAFAASDGRLLGFAKPLFIKPHHRSVYPDLFGAMHKPLVPPALSGALSRLATTVHPVVTRFPRVAAFTRHWSPEYFMVNPSRVFAKVQTEAPLGAVVFIERFAGPRMELESKGAAWMAARMIGNFYAEMSRRSREVMTALGATGLVPLPEPFSTKHEILIKLLEEKPVFLLRVPNALRTQEAAQQISDGVMQAAARAGID